MELSCICGQKHNWIPTCEGYYQWVSSDTYSPRPVDAPYFRKEKCATCGAIRHVLSQLGVENANQVS